MGNKKKLSLEDLAKVKIKDKQFVEKDDQEIQADLEKTEKEKEKKEKKELDQKLKEQWNMQHIKNVNNPANAPYNFVPINSEVLSFSDENAVNQHLYKENTGYIELEIENLTPLYIRDSQNEEKYLNSLEDKEHSVNTARSEHYSPNNWVAIPGSSLRGMLRNFIEIISFSKMKYFDDKTLYFRDFAKSPLKEEYKEEYKLADPRKDKNKFETESGGNLKCGILIKSGVKYKIIDYGKPSRIKKDETKKEAEKKGKRLNSSSWEWFKTADDKSMIIISGSIQQNNPKKRKNKDWKFDLNKGNDSGSAHKEINLTPQDIRDYKDDNLRANGKENPMVPDLLKEAGKKKEGVPVFYTQIPDSKRGLRTFLGHTAMFRLPYKKSIGDHISPAHFEDITDLAEVIFGLEDKFSSRVYFEDAVCDKPQEEVLMGEKVPHILSGPKPTAFQHYLVQKDTTESKLLHYNSFDKSITNPIRGFKKYWHKDGDQWQQTDNSEVNRAKSQYTKINPVKPNTKFKSRIRFENLNDIELGALLFSLDLPDGLCHKIGMGKPLGLGSIRIALKLVLSNRKKRYKDIMNEWENTQYENQNRLANLKSKFESEILSQLNNNAKSLWEVSRIQELKVMLDFNHRPEDSKTAYMRFPDGFRERKVLPSASEVAEK